MLPHVSRMTARALPGISDCNVADTTHRQETPVSPFVVVMRRGTTRQRTSESPLPCREHRPVTRLLPQYWPPASTQATLPDLSL